MYSLPSGYDAWKMNAPDDNGPWEQYREKYHDVAVAIVLDVLTETLPSSLTSRERVDVRGKLQTVVDGLDTETLTAWARELSDDAPPRFETWCDSDRAA